MLVFTQLVDLDLEIVVHACLAIWSSTLLRWKESAGHFSFHDLSRFGVRSERNVGSLTFSWYRQPHW